MTQENEKELLDEVQKLRVKLESSEAALREAESKAVEAQASVSFWMSEASKADKRYKALFEGVKGLLNLVEALG